MSLLACALALLSPCTSQTQSPASFQLLEFLSAERVTRDEVLARLGPPYSTFENGRVIAYRLGKGKEGYVQVPAATQKDSPGWKGVDYDLVLAFDEDGTLVQHNLIAIRAPPTP